MADIRATTEAHTDIADVLLSMNGAYVAFEGYIYVWGTLRTGLYLSVDIMLLVWTCCSRNGQGQIYI